jgi:hypothetical protein
VSFFNDDEGTSSSATRAQRPPRGARPAPRRPRPLGGHRAADRHALMMRRRVAAGVGVLVVIAVVLIVNAIVQGQKTSALEQYSREVNQLAHDSEQQVAKPLFVALVGAGGKPAINVEQQIDVLAREARQMATHAHEMSVPGEVTEAQRNLLLALQLRAEAVSKISTQMHAALGGQAKSASTAIAGAMEVLLSSDVLWSQRVTPLAREALSAGGLQGLSTADSRSLPNLGWLSPETVESRITGKSAAEAAGQVSSGTHGDAFTSLAVAGTTLEPEPGLNRLTGGGSPIFTVTFQNTGENSETNTKVVVSVTAGGKTVSGSQTVGKTEPGQTANAEIHVSGVSTGVAAKVEAKVEKVPGETNLENNKASYLAVFE